MLSKRVSARSVACAAIILSLTGMGICATRVRAASGVVVARVSAAISSSMVKPDTASGSRKESQNESGAFEQSSAPADDAQFVPTHTSVLHYNQKFRIYENGEE